MTWAILCRGPSLANVVHVAAARERTIAVNSAAWAGLPWRFWLALDVEQLRAIDRPERIRIVRDGIFLATPGLRHFAAVKRAPEFGAIWSEVPHIVFENYPTPIAQRVGKLATAHAFSATAAVIQAIARGATEILIYGADLVGDRYYDGAMLAKDCTRDRWARERQILGRVIRRAKAEGIRIKRVKA